MDLVLIYLLSCFNKKVLNDHECHVFIIQQLRQQRQTLVHLYSDISEAIIKLMCFYFLELCS